jgi:hypothetical protein
MRLTRSFAIGVFTLFGVAGTGAQASVVTMCKTDSDGGPGAANLQTALAMGGDITCQCPAGSIIAFTHAYLITRPTQINGSNAVTLDGGGHPMFVVRNGVSLRFADIAIRRGNADIGWDGASNPNVFGGVVNGDGDIELVRTTISDSNNAFSLHAGSIRIRKSRLFGNRGITVHAPKIEILDRSQFQTNTGTPVLATEGSVSITDSEFSANGTSTFSNCTLAILRSTFNANVVALNGGALSINCNAKIEKTQFHNNRADNGGAVYLGEMATEVMMRRVTFAGNIANLTGGAVALRAPTVPQTLTLLYCMFDSNRAQAGGGIYLGGNSQFVRGSAVIFKGNAATTDKGGAIAAFNAGIRMTRGAFVENQAVAGGGAVYAAQVHSLQSAEFANSVFIRNRSTQGGSAFQGTSAMFIASTIAGNDGVAVWPEAPLIFQPFGTVIPNLAIRFVGSILLGGSGAPCGPAQGKVPYSNLGHTIQFPGASCGSGIPTAFPALGPFLVPLPWSPALNQGDDTVCQTAPVNGRDIFGEKRPMLESCSIGAAEGDIPRVVDEWLHRRPERVAPYGETKKKE